MVEKNDVGKSQPLIALGDIGAALGLLTRIPLRVDMDLAQARSHLSPWAYPSVGLILATLVLPLAMGLTWIGLSSEIVALLTLIGLITLTGALHEDGLADCADGFWGGYTYERRLEIMKDSQIGTYGTLALIAGFALRWVALSAALEATAYFAIAAVWVASRAPMPALMALLPNARGTGLSAAQGQVSTVTAGLAASIALIIALLLTGGFALGLAGALLITAALRAALAKTKIGGQTGDVLGATQQVCEITGLLALTLAL